MTEQVKRFRADLCVQPIEVVAASDYDAAVTALHQQLEGLRAENEKWQRSHRDIHEPALREAHAYIQELRAELEAARGLLGELQERLDPHRDAVSWGKVCAFLTTTPAPEVRQTVKQARSVPEVSGIGRDADHPRVLLLYLRAEPTDDDVRGVQEALRRSAAGQG